MATKSYVPLTSDAPKKGRSSFSPLVLLLTLLVLGGSAAIVLGLPQTQQLRSKYLAPVAPTAKLSAAMSPTEVQLLVAKVAKHMAVKKGEAPTVATVEYPDPLRQQNPTFYQDAVKGDRVLIWSDQAVLYSEVKDKVLAVLPIASQVSAADAQRAALAAAIQAMQKEGATIEVRNGSKTVGLAKTAAEQLKALGFNAVVNGNAKGNYPATVIVSASKKAMPLTLQNLQALTGAKVLTSLAGENAAKADIVLIVGNDVKMKS